MFKVLFRTVQVEKSWARSVLKWPSTVEVELALEVMNWITVDVEIEVLCVWEDV